MGKILLAIDVDGVACDHAAAVCAYVAQRYNVECTREHVTSWDHNFGPVTFVQAVKEAYPDSQFLLAMQVTPGFSSFLSRIKNHVQVAFMTARKPFCREATEQWILTHFGEWPVVFCADKSQSEARLLLDDRADEVFRFAQGGRTGFLFAQPWNQHSGVLERVGASSQVYLARDFDHVYEQLGALHYVPPEFR